MDTYAVSIQFIAILDATISYECTSKYFDLILFTRATVMKPKLYALLEWNNNFLHQVNDLQLDLDC